MSGAEHFQVSRAWCIAYLMKNPKAASQLIGQGVDPATIRVYRETPFKVQVTVDLGDL